MTSELVRRARRQARVRRQQLLAERRATDPRRLDRGSRPAGDPAEAPRVSGGPGREGSAR